MTQVEDMSPEEYEREKNRIIDALVKYVEVECGPEEFRNYIEENWADIGEGFMYDESVYMYQPDYKLGETLQLDIDYMQIINIQPGLFKELDKIKSLKLMGYKEGFTLKREMLENCEKLEHLILFDIGNFDRNLVLETEMIDTLTLSYGGEGEIVRPEFRRVPLEISQLHKLENFLIDGLKIDLLHKNDFSGLTNLKSIHGSSIVKNLEKDCFRDLTNLKTLGIRIPAKEAMDEIQYCQNLEYLELIIDDINENNVKWKKILNLPNLSQLTIESNWDIEKIENEDFISLYRAIKLFNRNLSIQNTDANIDNNLGDMIDL